MLRVGIVGAPKDGKMMLIVSNILNPAVRLSPISIAMGDLSASAECRNLMLLS
jgi:hypothetical protein